MPAALLLVLVLALAGLSGCRSAPVEGPRPELSPAEVVAAQLAALQRGRDRDLETVYAYASPANQAATGPAPAFVRLLKEGYAPMIGHTSVELAPTFQTGDEALQAVILRDREGREHRYVFLLSRQNAPGCADCWVTDAVMPPDALLPAGHPPL